MTTAMTPVFHPPQITTPRAVAGLLLLSLWLGWVLPALLRSLPTPPQAMTAEQILDSLGGPVPAVGTPILLLAAGHCPCAAAAVAQPALHVIDRRDLAAALPYAWVVLDASRRLVYAGPAQLDLGCGGRSPSAAPLIQQLLAHPQAPLIVPSPCSCPQE
ncbi:hypothetical protein [Stenotrophomonas sp. SRS1]|uniref:hypothetical protein n=1 Tax=Stenotrophomonas sp. SRS1 TaxID=2870345 RepID=UPI002238DE0F|nr:hypothetical protein [Stenotrophomonas sp. SRS1]